MLDLDGFTFSKPGRRLPGRNPPAPSPAAVPIAVSFPFLRAGLRARNGTGFQVLLQPLQVLFDLLPGSSPHRLAIAAPIIPAGGLYWSSTLTSVPSPAGSIHEPDRPGMIDVCTGQRAPRHHFVCRFVMNHRIPAHPAARGAQTVQRDRSWSSC